MSFGMTQGSQPANSGTRKRKRLSQSGSSAEFPEPSGLTEELEWYITLLDSHIRDAAAYVQGHTEEKTLSISPKHGPTVLLPLHATWSTAEKEAFFASLSRRSRLRPDLIAEDTGKTESEVVDYIATLRQGADAVRRTDGMTPGNRDRSARWDSARRWVDGRAPSAIQVDEEWIDQEEALAGQVLRLEKEALDKIFQVNQQEHRRVSIKAVKKQARKEGRRSAPDVEVESRLLDKQEALHRWGREIDSSKLSLLHAALRPLFLGSYGASADSTEDVAEHLSLSHRFPRNEIAEELQEIEAISVIPFKERSKEQRTLFRTMVNRKKNREKYRLKQLLEEGMAQKEIDDLGGPDAIIEGRKKGSDGPRKKAKSSDSPKVDLEEEDLLNLSKLGGDVLAAKRGWDVFNFQKIPSLTASLTGHESSLSFEMFDALREELLAYLVPLVLHVITIAEASSEQDASDEVTQQHVQQVCALRGEAPRLARSEMLHRASDGVFSIPNHEAVDKYLGSTAKPPDTLAWSSMSLLGGLDQGEDEEDEDEAETDEEEDEEDEALDAAMERMDAANDALDELRLRYQNDTSQDADLAEASDAVTSATSEYHQLQLATNRARVKRNSLKHRSAKWTSTRLRIQGGQLRAGKSRAVILDSDSEEVDLGSEGQAGDETVDDSDESRSEDADEGRSGVDDED